MIQPRRQLVKRKVQPAPDPGGLYFSSAKENIQFIRSGCTLLDCVTGGGLDGAWPLGRIVNIVGDKSTGKTLLAMEAIANFFRQYPKGRCWYNEVEAAFDIDYAKALGIPMDRVTFIEDCDTVEQWFKQLQGIVADKSAPGLYILDSLDALSDTAEMKRDVDKGSYAMDKAKMLSEFFRRITKSLKRSKICLMVISQVRDNVGAGLFEKKHKRSGGKALDFYCSVVIWLSNMGKLDQTKNKVKRVIGVQIKANCDKNKVSMPYRQCAFDITFGYGIEDEKASLAWLEEVGSKPPPRGLREFVVAEWYRIEQQFLPTRRKYGTEGAIE